MSLKNVKNQYCKLLLCQTMFANFVGCVDGCVRRQADSQTGRYAGRHVEKQAG
jgi:hypothetical protein